jgi:hypothetical protein
MLTYKKLKIFKKYDGDGDHWLLSSWWWERDKMTGEDWALIGQLISDLKLLNNGLAAPSYTESVEARIRENCEDEKTIAN